jgi:hypothetical protein
MTKDVWRLEISIKGNSWKYVDPGTGEIRQIELNDLKEMAFLEGTYFHFLHKEFDIRVNDGSARHNRLRQVPLFNERFDQKDFERSYLSEDGSKMDKFFIRNMEHYNKTQRQDKQLHHMEFELLTYEYAERHGLVEWYRKNVRLPVTGKPENKEISEVVLEES